MIAEDGSDPPPSDPFDPSQVVPYILTSSLDVGVAAEGNAFAQAYMRYFGNSGDETTTLQIRYNGQFLMTVGPGHSADSRFFPQFVELWSSTGAGLSGSCGFDLNGTATYTASTVLAGITVGSTTSSSNKTYSQGPCAPVDDPPPSDSGGGGGGGTSYDDGSSGDGGGWMICYHRDWYIDGVFWYREEMGCSLMQ
jgi:hypothetical protein